MRSAIGTVHTYEYGTSEVVRFEGERRIEVYRPFVVHPKEPWNAAVTERVFSTGPSDASVRFHTYPYNPAMKYDSRCSCCYLGFTHTADLHARNIGAAP